MASTGHIAEGIRLVGEIRGQGDLRIDGFVDGIVSVEGRVFIGTEGLVEGRIEAGAIRIEGRLIGHARATRTLEAGPRACVDGDLEAPEIRLDPLAAVTGEIFGRVVDAGAPRGVRPKRGSSPHRPRKAIPEPKMPVMLREKGVRLPLA